MIDTKIDTKQNTKQNIKEDIKEDITIDIDGVKLIGKYREFKSGKKGYGAYGMIKIHSYPHRVSINLIEVG